MTLGSCCRIAPGIALLLAVVGPFALRSQAQESSGRGIPCREPWDSLRRVDRTSGVTSPLRLGRDGPIVTSAERILVVDSAGRCRQRLRINRAESAKNDTMAFRAGKDTIIVTRTIGGGGSGQTVIALKAVREYLGLADVESDRLSLELAGNVLVGGEDTSERRVSFHHLAYGGVFALHYRLSPTFSFSLGGRALLESVRDSADRLRFPIVAGVEVCVASWGGGTSERCEYVTESTVSAPCQFQAVIRAPRVHPPSDLQEVTPTAFRSDPDTTVYLHRERTSLPPFWRLVVYAEGGPVLNGSFEGRGASPSLNPDDYGQWLLGGGAGIAAGPIRWFLPNAFVVLRVGYQRMRLNLRTPCPVCAGEYLVNSNISNAVLLQLGLRIQLW